MIKNQLGRRNLVPLTRFELVDKLKVYISDKGKENKRTNSFDKLVEKEKINCITLDKPLLINSQVDTIKELANIAGTSRATAAKANKIIEKAPEELE